MRPSDKLDFIRVESFKVVKVLGPVTYKPNLSDSMQIT